MPNISTILERLRGERADIDATIRTLERLTGSARRSKADRNARIALNLIDADTINANGDRVGLDTPARRGWGGARTAGKKRGRPRLTGASRKAFRTRDGKGKPRAVAEVPIPNGLTLADTPYRDAIVLAVKAVRKPIPTPELFSLLQRAGATAPDSKHPPIRQLGLMASALAHHRILKKTADGWTKGAKA